MNLIGQCFNPRIIVDLANFKCLLHFFIGAKKGYFWLKKFIFDKNNLKGTILFVCVLECFLMFLNVSEQMTF